MVENEGLAAGVVTKRNLWHAPATVADARPELDPTELDELIVGATAQFERILAAYQSGRGASLCRDAAPVESCLMAPHR